MVNNHPVPCLGIGTKIYRIDGLDIGLCQVLHVPALKAPLISVQQHRRHQGCSFIADNGGCFLTFPTFSITIDDSTDCLVRYTTVPPNKTVVLQCDHMQKDPDQIEQCAITESSRFDRDRRSWSTNTSSP
jgi:hypothetical protein